MKNIKNKGLKRIFAIFTVMAVLATAAMGAFAEGTADPSVTAAFTTLQGNVIATLGAVAVLGVTVMGIFLAWKYGRKIFNQVAK
jgi:hypothetical protein